MLESQQHPFNFHFPVAARPPSRLSSVLKFLVVTYLVGMFVLSTEQFLALPQNLTSGDFWNVLFLPICWYYLIRSRQAIRFSLALGMWLILLGSLTAALFSLYPMASIVVIVKEVYLYIWFVTIVSVFTSLEPGLVRRLLLVWTSVAVIHGILLMAEFLSPTFYQFMISILSRMGNVDSRYVGRVAGLFENPVWAALFQLMGFVPLLLGGLRRELSLFLGMFLLLGILATASLGALSSLLGAAGVAVILLLLMGGHLKFLVWLATVVVFAGGLFLFALSQFPDILASIQHLTTDRAAHTAGERIDLWGGGTAVLFSQKAILGVGPNNYRDFLENKTLHNDILEFGVERGVIGLLGLALLAGEAWINAIAILLNQIKSRDRARPSGVIFIAMLVAILLESSAHQIFHFRTVWLGVALVETAFAKMISAPMNEIEQLGKQTRSPEKLSPSIERYDPSASETG